MPIIVLMQVVRFPSFSNSAAVSKIRNAMSLGLLTFSLAMIGLLFASARGMFLLGAALCAASALNQTFQALSPWLGDQGENLVEKELECLNDCCLLIRNWVPTNANRPNGDIDFVLLGPFGALVIEVKTYTVTTKCENDRWVIRRKNGSWRPIKSLSRQLTNNVKLVSKSLNCKVTGVLVFNDRADLRIEGTSICIIRRRNLLDLIGTLADDKQDAAQLWKQLSGEEIQKPAPAVA